MRVLERRLRRLEEGLLPPPETAESRRLREVVLDIRRRRAARLGIPVEEDGPDPKFRPGMSLGEMIIAARQRRPRADAGRTLLNRDCLRHYFMITVPAPWRDTPGPTLQLVTAILRNQRRELEERPPAPPAQASPSQVQCWIERGK